MDQAARKQEAAGGMNTERYQTLVQLGAGAHATTYLAHDVPTGAQVVVRVPHPELLDDASFAYSYEREALELLRVHHPHIVRVLDAGRAGDTPFVVAEYIEGESLWLRLSGRSSCQSPTEIYDWLFDISEALDFIHAKKAVHGEVRPGSVLFDGERARLTDFVLGATVCRMRASTAPAWLDRSDSTFVPPEQRAGAVPGPASDQYGLASLVYLAVTGHAPPKDQEERASALRRHLSDEAAADLLRGLAADPESRFPSCYEFARAFGLERKRPGRIQKIVGAPGSTSDFTAPNSLGPGHLERQEMPDGPDYLSADSEQQPNGMGPEHAPRLVIVDSGKTPVAASLKGRGRGPRPPELPARGTACWCVRQGALDRYAGVARELDFVAAGWPELGDLGWLREAANEGSAQQRLVEEFEHALGVSGLRARIGASQLWRFEQEMTRGDLVLVPDLANEKLYVGRISGDAKYDVSPRDGCPLPRRRPVVWVRDAAWSEVPHALRRCIQTPDPIVSLCRKAEIAWALEEESDSATASRARERQLHAGIVDALFSASLDEFTMFVRGLLQAVGYDAELLPGSSDESWEAGGRLASRGLADIPLRVTVHRARRQLDVDAVFEARGTLAADEQGAIISLGGFTPRAASEASAHRKKPIRLLDGPSIAALALEVWDGLPATARAALGVRRSEQTSIQVHFELMGPR